MENPPVYHLPFELLEVIRYSTNSLQTAGIKSANYEQLASCCICLLYMQLYYHDIDMAIWSILYDYLVYGT